MCIIAAAEGLEKPHETHPDVQIYMGYLDWEINEDVYICPGVGDAGDKIFGAEDSCGHSDGRALCWLWIGGHSDLASGGYYDGSRCGRE